MCVWVTARRICGVEWIVTLFRTLFRRVWASALRRCSHHSNAKTFVDKRLARYCDVYCQAAGDCCPLASGGEGCVDAEVCLRGAVGESVRLLLGTGLLYSSRGVHREE
jgi:hypothetical protein